MLFCRKFDFAQNNIFLYKIYRGVKQIHLECLAMDSYNYSWNIIMPSERYSDDICNNVQYIDNKSNNAGYY